MISMETIAWDSIVSVKAKKSLAELVPGQGCQKEPAAAMRRVLAIQNFAWFLTDFVQQLAAQAPTRRHADAYSQNFWHPCGEASFWYNSIKALEACFNMTRLVSIEHGIIYFLRLFLEYFFINPCWHWTPKILVWVLRLTFPWDIRLLPINTELNTSGAFSGPSESNKQDLFD